MAGKFIVHYPSDESEEGRNVGPFSTQAEALRYLDEHPAQTDDWDACVYSLENPTKRWPPRDRLELAHTMGQATPQHSGPWVRGN